jgi:hypothetical protein
MSKYDDLDPRIRPENIPSDQTIKNTRMSLLEKIRMRLVNPPDVQDDSAADVVNHAPRSTTSAVNLPSGRSHPSYLTLMHRPDVADSSTSDTYAGAGMRGSYSTPPSYHPRPNLKLVPTVSRHIKEQESPISEHGPPR